MNPKFKVDDNVVFVEKPYQGNVLIIDVYTDGTYLCQYKERSAKTNYIPIQKRGVFKESELTWPPARTIVLRPKLDR